MNFIFRLFAFITTFGTHVISFSGRQAANTKLPVNQDFGILNLYKPQQSSVDRRSYLSSLLGGCAFALGVDSNPACAEEEISSDPCTTSCMYDCKARTMAKKDRSTSIERLMEDCKEQCPGRESCHETPPQRKQAPQLLQSKRISGLYPRWQDDF